jgi:hypothetical protein
MEKLGGHSRTPRRARRGPGSNSGRNASESTPGCAQQAASWQNLSAPTQPLPAWADSVRITGWHVSWRAIWRSRKSLGTKRMRSDGQARGSWLLPPSLSSRNRMPRAVVRCTTADQTIWKEESKTCLELTFVTNHCVSVRLRYFGRES